MSTADTASARLNRPRYASHFLATLVLTVLMLCGMTLYYGFRDLRRTADDIALTILKQTAEKHAQGLSAAAIAQESLQQFRDTAQIQVCLADHCGTQRTAEEAPLTYEWLANVGWPCASQYADADKVTVCMSIDDIVDDISRDIAVLVLAKAISFSIWVAASRRFATRRRIWNERVNRAATTDSATGLLNRASFHSALDQFAGRGDEAWLVLAGIDELKSVNELHGSAVGDHLITTVASRLQGLGELTHALARTGGDEFAFIVRGAGPLTLERALGRLRAAMNEPIEHQGLLLRVSLCAGAAAVEQQLHAPELMRRAHIALRAAKKVGADSQSIFNIAFDIELRKTHQLRLDLMSAVDKGQLELAYQPIVDAQGQVVMAEALARWRHPELGNVPPDVFIAAAEASGLIHQLGIALLKTACNDLVAARARGLALKRIAVNLSPTQLTNPDLAQIVLAVVRRAGLQPADIELELTESAAMASRQDTTLQLHELAEAGFAISIDDFGTGYSSLSRLQTLPISKLKIDRSFVQACDEPAGAVLLEAMLNLAGRLSLACVAEGVETEAQMAWLKARGCGLFQGYLLGKPMPIDQLVGLGVCVPVRGTAACTAPQQAAAAVQQPWHATRPA